MGEHWLPLFPLNTVLFPHMPLPLQVFERRYKLMLRDCLDAGQSFGVVAIREGEETGAPAVPHDVGTLAKIVNMERLDDGRVKLLITGTTRFRVLRTSDDRPYLRGSVRFLAERGDDPEDTREVMQGVAAAFADYRTLLRQLADSEPESIEPPLEPELLSYLVAALLNVPLSLKQELLALDRTDHRLQAELRILRKENALLKQMLARKTQAVAGKVSLN
jgi:Lon protease-like protein